ncbi:MAG: hypothetical protein NUV74_05190 [Candidatus Brocadiaceae bacterium]|nr:hypothetical protein [Candidatus Brocadiaceae bacterium]
MNDLLGTELERMTMERFNPCTTDTCKTRCDKFGVACEEICIDEIKRLRTALATVKGYVTGDMCPNWKDPDATYRSRGYLADVCDAALMANAISAP